MKKLIILLCITIAFGCQKQSPKTGSIQEEPSVIAFNTAKEKCYAAVKNRIDTLNKYDNANTDTIVYVSIDSATEKTAQLYYCGLLENVKKSTDRYVNALKTEIEFAKKVHESLANSSKAQLKVVLEKQKTVDKELIECMQKANTVDSVTFKYFRIKTEAIRTIKDGKDTLRGPFFVDTAYKLKTF